MERRKKRFHDWLTIDSRARAMMILLILLKKCGTMKLRRPRMTMWPPFPLCCRLSFALFALLRQSKRQQGR